FVTRGRALKREPGEFAWINERKQEGSFPPRRTYGAAPLKTGAAQDDELRGQQDDGLKTRVSADDEHACRVRIEFDVHSEITGLARDVYWLYGCCLCIPRLHRFSIARECYCVLAGLRAFVEQQVDVGVGPTALHYFQRRIGPVEAHCGFRNGCVECREDCVGYDLRLQRRRWRKLRRRGRGRQLSVHDFCPGEVGGSGGFCVTDSLRGNPFGRAANEEHFAAALRERFEPGEGLR